MKMFLYKAFTEKEYKEQFLDGKIRFTLQESYKGTPKKYSPPRDDESEGEARGHLNGYQYSYSVIGPIYLVSFFGMNADINECIERYKYSYVVKIINPVQLLNRLRERCHPVWQIGNFELKPRIYDKYEDLHEMDRVQRHEHAILQKPSTFDKKTQSDVNWKNDDEWILELRGKENAPTNRCSLETRHLDFSLDSFQDIGSIRDIVHQLV